MNDINKNIRRVFMLFCALFMLIAAYLCKFILADSKEIVNNSYNPRLKMIYDDVKRGSILAADGEVLAESAEIRSYPYGKKFSHLVGTIQMGKTGVEQKYDFLLQHPSWELLQRLNNESVVGDTAVLTIDVALQELAYAALGENKGAVVIMEPSTGKVLAMASYPNYDPAALESDWKDVFQDGESPLLNRATQGLYPPGSVFKTLTAVAAVRSGLSGFEFECTGVFEYNGERIRCFNSNAHGYLNMSQALAVSCNGYFASVAVEMGAQALIDTCGRAYFGNDLQYPIERGKSSFALDADAGSAEIMQTAIGQGRTLVTPLHMAMLTSAIANGGLMMKPYVLERELNAYGKSKNITLPSALNQVFEYDEAEALSEMMTMAVDSGTAAPASTAGVKIAAKTGTAENPQGDEHGWVVAFAPTDSPQIAIAVVMEHSGGPRKGLELVKAVVETISR